MPRNIPDIASCRGRTSRKGISWNVAPFFLPPADLAEPWDEAAFAWQERDVVVMTQSCDLVDGREKVTEVLLCAIWSRSGWKMRGGAISRAIICSPSAAYRAWGGNSASLTSGASIRSR